MDAVEAGRLQAAMEVLDAELQRERRTSEGYRQRLMALSEEVGRGRSKIEQLEGRLAGAETPGSLEGARDEERQKDELRDELQHKEILIAKLQRQVDDDQAVIGDLRRCLHAADAAPTPPAPAPRPPVIDNRHTTPPRSQSAQRRVAHLDDEVARLQNALRVQEEDARNTLAAATIAFEQDLTAARAAAAGAAGLSVELAEKTKLLDALVDPAPPGQDERQHTRNMSRRLLEYYKAQVDELQKRLDEAELRGAELEAVHRGTVRLEDQKKIDDLQRAHKRERQKWMDERDGFLRAAEDQQREAARLRELVVRPSGRAAGHVAAQQVQAAYDALLREYHADKAEWVADRQRLLSRISVRTSPARAGGMDSATSPMRLPHSPERPAVAHAVVEQELLASRVEIDRLRQENAELALEMEALAQEMADRRRMVEVVAQKAAQFAGTKKILQTQFDVDKQEITRLSSRLQELEDTTERLTLQAEVDRTARHTSAQLASVFSLKTSDLLHTLRAAAARSPDPHTVTVPLATIQSQAAMFEKLTAQCDRMIATPPRALP